MTGCGEPEQVKAQLVTPAFCEPWESLHSWAAILRRPMRAPRRDGRVVLMSYALISSRETALWRNTARRRTLPAGCPEVILVARVAVYLPARRAVQQDPKYDVASGIAAPI